MISDISTSLSGVNAAITGLDVSAENIANVSSTQSTGPNGETLNTPYVPQRVVQTSLASGGVATSIQQVSPASVAEYDPRNPAASGQGIVQVPNVDLAQQVIDTNMAGYSAQANLVSIKAWDQTMQWTLNIVA